MLASYVARSKEDAGGYECQATRQMQELPKDKDAIIPR